MPAKLMTEPRGLRLTEDQWAKADQMAAEDHLPWSYFFRRLIEQEWERRHGKESK